MSFLGRDVGKEELNIRGSDAGCPHSGVRAGHREKPGRDAESQKRTKNHIPERPNEEF